MQVGKQNIFLTFYKTKNGIYICIVFNGNTLVTQPMLQLRPNWSELRSMDYYHQIFCRFRKCKRKVPPSTLLTNEKSPMI